jgi:choloylglycine hydrolase
VPLKAKDDSILIGRTLEFGPDLKSNLITSPKGKNFLSPAENGKPGLNWTAKYGYLMLDFFETGHAIDGMNEKGLSMGLLYLPGYTEYQTAPQNKENAALHYFFVGDWVLSNFATIDEVKSAIKNIYVYGTPETLGSMKNVLFPLHMIVTDATGKSIVIEWHNGKTVVYDNPIGILTNSPSFDWQITNLKNYANLSPYLPSTLNIDGIQYSGTGQGSGSVGLPGDYTPPSRFVKMSFLVGSSTSANNIEENLNLAQHIINNVDIPIGVVRGIKGEKNDIPDRTQWAVFKDLKNLKLYYKSYNDTTIHEIDMQQLDFSKNSPVLKMPITSSQYLIKSTLNLKATDKKK